MDTQALEPLNDHLVVARATSDETTAGGIVVPDVAKEKPKHGQVVAVGPGRWEDGQRVPMSVANGDTVLFGSYAGSEVKLGERELIVLREEDLLGIIRG